MTYYEMLGVLPTADVDVIHAAYRTLAKKYHPDTGGNAAKFNALSEAHAVLTDSYKRRKYDATLAPKKPRKKAQAPQEANFTQQPSYRQPYEDPRFPRQPDIRQTLEDLSTQATRAFLDQFLGRTRQ